jgi:hypothetical protein
MLLFRPFCFHHADCNLAPMNLLCSLDQLEILWKNLFQCSMFQVFLDDKLMPFCINICAVSWWKGFMFKATLWMWNITLFLGFPGSTVLTCDVCVCVCVCVLHWFW